MHVILHYIVKQHHDESFTYTKCGTLKLFVDHHWFPLGIVFTKGIASVPNSPWSLKYKLNQVQVTQTLVML